MSRAYRSRGQAIGIAAMALALDAFLIGVYLSAPDRRRTGVALAIILAVCVVGTWFLVRRCALGGVFFDRDGVRVLNPLRTHRIPWDEVDRFEVGYWMLSPVGTVVRRDGSRVWAFAIESPVRPNPPKKSGVERLVDELNAELARAPQRS